MKAKGSSPVIWLSTVWMKLIARIMPCQAQDPRLADSRVVISPVYGYDLEKKGGHEKKGGQEKRGIYILYLQLGEERGIHILYLQ
jgi:hypothetical protein